MVKVRMIFEQLTPEFYEQSGYHLSPISPACPQQSSKKKMSMKQNINKLKNAV